MAASNTYSNTAQAQADRVRRFWQETLQQVQGRMKDAERLWAEALGQMNQLMQTAERDARELAKKVETDSKKRFEALKGQLNVDELVDRIKNVDFGIPADAADRINLTALKDAARFDDAMARLNGAVETLKSRVGGGISREDLDELLARIADLEAQRTAFDAASKKAEAATKKAEAATKKADASTKKAVASTKKADAIVKKTEAALKKLTAMKATPAKKTAAKATARKATAKKATAKKATAKKATAKKQ